MKGKHDQIGRAGLIILTVLFFLLAGAVEVLAAEGGGGWRPTYDIIMKWVNFGILAFIFFKFARRPLKNFLSDKKNEISLQIKKLEDELHTARTNSEKFKDVPRELHALFPDITRVLISEAPEWSASSTCPISPRRGSCSRT